MNTLKAQQAKTHQYSYIDIYIYGHTHAEVTTNLPNSYLGNGLVGACTYMREGKCEGRGQGQGQGQGLGQAQRTFHSRTLMD